MGDGERTGVISAGRAASRRRLGARARRCRQFCTWRRCPLLSHRVRSRVHSGRRPGAAQQSEPDVGASVARARVDAARRRRHALAGSGPAHPPGRGAARDARRLGPGDSARLFGWPRGGGAAHPAARPRRDLRGGERGGRPAGGVGRVGDGSGGAAAGHARRRAARRRRRAWRSATGGLADPSRGRGRLPGGRRCR